MNISRNNIFLRWYYLNKRVWDAAYIGSTSLYYEKDRINVCEFFRELTFGTLITWVAPLSLYGLSITAAILSVKFAYVNGVMASLLWAPMTVMILFLMIGVVVLVTNGIGLVRESMSEVNILRKHKKTICFDLEVK